MRRSVLVAWLVLALAPSAAAGQSTNDPNNYDPADPDIYRPAPRPKPQQQKVQRDRVQQAVPGSLGLSQQQLTDGVVVAGPTAAELAERQRAADRRRAERRRRAAARQRRAAARRREARRERLADERAERLAEEREAERLARLRVVEARKNAKLASSRVNGNGDGPVGVLLLVGGLPAAALALSAVGTRGRRPDQP